jgi:nitrous oxide reductase accessory protein NosL
MKKKVYVVLMAVLFVLGGLTSFALAQEDIQKHPTCKYCGMDRAKFAHSRVLVVYEDGTEVGVCSIHCAALDLALNIDKTPKSIMVGEYDSKKLIDAEKAQWVMGGDKMGVMTKRAKWAFDTKEAGDKYIDANGGELVTFDDAMKASFADMYADTKMIRDKRKMMKAKGAEQKGGEQQGNKEHKM